jgi:pimeloyl-ACP methyl ester carboxylesterase
MATPPVRYATTSDGKRIAYSVAGDGPTLVWMPGLFSHVQMMEHELRVLTRELRKRLKVVLYDARGQGMSSRGLSPDHTMADWERDLGAVLDAVSPGEPALVVGVAHSGHIAARYATGHPDRVAALIFVSCCVHQAEWGPKAFWEKLPFENWELFLTALLPRGIPLESQRRALAAMKSMVTQDEYRLFDEAVIKSSVEADLPLLRKPSLVVHPRNLTQLRPEQGVEFASLIPDSRFRQIGGSEDAMLGNLKELLAAVDDFIWEILPPTTTWRPEKPVALPAEPLTARELDILRLSSVTSRISTRRSAPGAERTPQSSRSEHSASDRQAPVFSAITLRGPLRVYRDVAAQLHRLLSRQNHRQPTGRHGMDDFYMQSELDERARLVRQRQSQPPSDGDTALAVPRPGEAWRFARMVVQSWRRAASWPHSAIFRWLRS